eukprot:1105357-Amphidinium_carterae.1
MSIDTLGSCECMLHLCVHCRSTSAKFALACPRTPEPQTPPVLPLDFVTVSFLDDCCRGA